MQIEQITPNLWSLKSWMIISVRVWIAAEPDGLTLIDAGASFMAKGILRFVEQSGKPLKQILLTHGHSDHIGAVTKIRERYPVPVYAHAVEIPYLEGDLPYPRRKKAEAGLPKGLVQPLAMDPHNRLMPVGGLIPYLTPGHAPGHVAYYHADDAVLLAGDLFTSKGGRLHHPMPIFTADMAEAVRSSAVVAQLKPKRVEVCHGAPVFDAAADLDAYQLRTAARFGFVL